jgi:hypothetical protein
MPDRHLSRLIILLAIAARVAAVLVLHDPKAPPYTYEHGPIAENLLAGRGFSVKFLGAEGPTSQQAPMYPALVAVAYAMGGVGTPRALLELQLGQALLGGVLVAALMAMARSIAPDQPRMALVAGLIAALHPTLVYAATHIQVASLAATLLTITLALAYRAGRDRDAMATGLALAGLMLTDPILGLVAPGVAWAIALGQGRSRVIPSLAPSPAASPPRPSPPMGEGEKQAFSFKRGGWPGADRNICPGPTGRPVFLPAENEALSPCGGGLSEEFGPTGAPAGSAHGIQHSALSTEAQRSAPQGTSRLVAWVAVTAALGVLPWIMRNAHVHGELIWIKSTFGYAFWQGNCRWSEGTDKVVRASVERVLSDARSGGLRGWNETLWAARHEAGYLDDIALTPADYRELGSVSEPERSRRLFRRALADLHSEPGRYARLCLRRLRYFVLFDETNPKTRSLLYRAGHLGLTLLAGFGLVLAGPCLLHRLGPTLLTAVLITLFHTFTIVSVRFHIPIEPLLALWGAAGLHWRRGQRLIELRKSFSA